MKPIKFFGMLSLLLVISWNALAQEAPAGWGKLRTDSSQVLGRRHAFNFCPGGIAFGIISANYEHLFHPNHGLVFRMDYEGVPKTYSVANIESHGMAFILNYRWHLQGGMESVFVGGYSRYRFYQGEGKLEGTEFDFTMPDLTLGVNVGKRWVWKSGLTATFALGYGYSFDLQDEEFTNPAIRNAIGEFEEGYDFINPFYGELSIGYAF